jgi:hypothetical protein
MDDSGLEELTEFLVTGDSVNVLTKDTHGFREVYAAKRIEDAIKMCRKKRPNDTITAVLVCNTVIFRSV